MLLPTDDEPSDNILESLYKMRMREFDQLLIVLALYDQDSEQKNTQHCHQRLKNVTAMKGNKEITITGKQKECVRKETHAGSTIKVNVDNLRSYLLSKIAHEQRWVKSSEEKLPRGSSPFEKRLRRPCKDYLNGNCTNPSCDSWHPPLCQNYKSQFGCEFGEKCSFVHKEGDRQPN